MQSADSPLELCLVKCSACLDASLELATRLCAAPADSKVSNSILRLLDCAQMCELAIGFIARGSPLQKEVCAICGEISEACAARFELFEGGEACAAACRECATACFDVWRSATGLAPSGSARAVPPGGDTPELLSEARYL